MRNIVLAEKLMKNKDGFFDNIDDAIFIFVLMPNP